MRLFIRLSMVVAVVVFGTSSALATATGGPLDNHSRVTYPSAVSLEVLGRSMLYSVNFDQVLNDNIAAGVGFGTVSMQAHNTSMDADKTASFVPAYMNYYFNKAANSPFVTGGVTLILNHSSVKGLDTSTGGLQIPTSSVMPTFGGGYESRSDTGFLFRVTGYLIAGRDLTPWLGFSFGYGF
jgi:hypothetical protein